MGRAVAANLVGRFGLHRDEQLTFYLARVGNHLASWSSRPELPWRFGILDTDEINAFACPGGYVFVTRGALDLTDDESELAALLAHEIQHVTERHAVKSIQASYRNKALVSEGVKAGGRGLHADPALIRVFGELTDDMTNTLLEKGLSRKLELKADRDAILLLADGGYDPQALERVIQRMAAKRNQAKLGILKRTHPPAARRAKEAIKSRKGEDLEPKPEARFAELFAAETAPIEPRGGSYGG